MLADDEQLVARTRTHAKALFLPALVLLVVVALAGYLSSLPQGSSRSTWLIVIWVVAALALLVFTLWPFLKWLATTYVVTNRRLITRTGVFTRRGHDIPLNRVSDVSYERGLFDRMLGCGTLVISDASQEGRVRLRDVPRVEHLQLEISDQVFHGTRQDDDGT
ncbi:MAG: PH domain-containing protein [Actinomycetota bacterium]|nr:PH domain-containing protein [Actinomycetota bacterium]